MDVIDQHVDIPKLTSQVVDGIIGLGTGPVATKALEALKAPAAQGIMSLVRSTVERLRALGCVRPGLAGGVAGQPHPAGRHDAGQSEGGDRDRLRRIGRRSARPDHPAGEAAARRQGHHVRVADPDGQSHHHGRPELVVADDPAVLRPGGERGGVASLGLAALPRRGSARRSAAGPRSRLGGGRARARDGPDGGGDQHRPTRVRRLGVSVAAPQCRRASPSSRR